MSRRRRRRISQAQRYHYDLGIHPLQHLHRHIILLSLKNLSSSPHSHPVRAISTSSYIMHSLRVHPHLYKQHQSDHTLSPPKPATFATLNTPPFKKDATRSLPPTPPATPALTANGDTIGKINDIPTLLMILRTREQQKIPQQSFKRPMEAEYFQHNTVDYDETPTKKRKL